MFFSVFQVEIETDLKNDTNVFLHFKPDIRIQ